MKVTKVERQDRTVIKAKTTKRLAENRSIKWWLEKDEAKRSQGLLTTAAFLKETQGYRYRQAAIYARLYGNMSLFNFMGSNISSMDKQMGLPADRPTRNVVQGIVDTLVSRLTQNRPAPVFLTDNADYKERNLAKKLNNFILGEFYQTKVYDKAEQMLRDGLVEGTGCLKVVKNHLTRKVEVERKLLTELLVDPNEAMYGEPRQMYELKLIDRDVLMANYPKFRQKIAEAEAAYPDSSADASKTASDLVMVVEGWRLPSGPDSGDGYHSISCSAGELFGEEYTKDKFPFVFFHYAPRMLGFWAQGVAERQMGTQLDINSMLYQISRAIKLVGVPRVFQEDGSKVVASHHNNDVGVIVRYSGTKPEYEVAPCVPQEMYAQLDRMVEYAFNSEGVSQMQASSQKPAGLDSGEAIRAYDNINTDRFASTSKRFDNVFVDLAYLIVETAKEIAEEDGTYQTIFPDRKSGAKTIDLPDISLLKNPFVIQVFTMSSLPKDPAGRMQKVTEMVQSGMITLREGRRLLDYPDLDQIETLANAAEERIFQQLDAIVEDGKYTPPDPFTDIQLANDLSVQYYNLYTQFKLEEEKAQMLRDYYVAVQSLKAAATPQPAPGATPQAAPMPLPQSPLIPNGPQAA